MLQKLYAFLARAPALTGITLAVGDAGPAPSTAGLWCKGVTVRQRCRAEFTLRLCLPLPPGDSATAAENAAHLLALQTWVAAECAAGRAPVFGNADPARETLRAEQGKLERADAGGTAVYSLRIRAEYTQLYTEETP